MVNSGLMLKKRTTFSTTEIKRAARPPFFRYSTVFSAIKRRMRLRTFSIMGMISATLLPSRAACAAACACRPWPQESDSESNTATLPAKRCAATLAELKVPLCLDVIVTQTTSAPSATSGANVSSKTPTDGCDVPGCTVCALRQNSSASSWRSRYISSPKLTLRGTTVIPHRAASSGKISDALSVTTRTCGMPCLLLHAFNK